MSYPQQPNFGIATSDSAWFKNNNPGTRQSSVCSTNGAGFIRELKSALLLWATRGATTDLQGNATLWQQIQQVPAVVRALTSGSLTPRKPDGSSTAAAYDPRNFGGDVKWNETTQVLLAAWFRSATGGEVSILPPPGVDPTADAAYTAMVANMPAWAKTIHLLLRSDFLQQRISDASLRTAAWCISYHKDLASGGRMGGGGPRAVGLQLTDFADIQVPNPVPPPWDVDVQGTPQAISCSLEREQGVVISVPRGTLTGSRGILDFSGYTWATWAKIAAVAAVGGAGGYMLSKSWRGKSRKRRR